MNPGAVTFAHQTVLLKEAVAMLEPTAGKTIIDGTLGGGGHAEALLRHGATVIGVDRDPSAIKAASERLKEAPHFRAKQGNFAHLPSLLPEVLPVDGALLDLGVSSPQLDKPERGFSFSKDGPLDMRMSNEGETAAELISRLPEKELEKIISTLGEERFARPIARELKRSLPQRTLEAAGAVARAVPRRAWPKRIHVATRTFQALRMAVNHELESLDSFLADVPRLLKMGGVAVVITFHSLEDRRVKEAFRTWVGSCHCPPKLPVCVCAGGGDFAHLTKKAVTASEAEVHQNPRARSARLRAVKRVR